MTMMKVKAWANGLEYDVTDASHAAAPLKAERLSQRWLTTQMERGTTARNEPRRDLRSGVFVGTATAAWLLIGSPATARGRCRVQVKVRRQSDGGL
jgi:hypothetical protein